MGRVLFHHFLQIIPAEEKLRLVRGLGGAVIDPAKDKLPVAGIDVARQIDGVPQFPAVFLHEFTADDAGVPLLLKGLELIFRNDEFGKKIEKALRPDRHAREEMPFVNIDAAKPVGIGNLAHPGNLQDFLPITDGQREDQGDGIPRHETVRGGGGNPGIPGIHHGAQQAEGKDGHGHAQDRQRGPQALA